MIDKERRDLHSRIHSAGHVIDMALKSLSLDWVPGKGYHFPDGPYVKYEGKFKDDPVTLKEKIEQACLQLIQSKLSVEVKVTDLENLSSLCDHIPTYLPKDKPVRVVIYGGFGIACGGTHVENLSIIGRISIRKLRQKKGVVKISYEVN